MAFGRYVADPMKAGEAAWIELDVTFAEAVDLAGVLVHFFLRGNGPTAPLLVDAGLASAAPVGAPPGVATRSWVLRYRLEVTEPGDYLGEFRVGFEAGADPRFYPPAEEFVRIHVGRSLAP